MSQSKTNNPRAAWLDYKAVWRWHFYAGLFCIPFVVFLSITGSMYLFKPQFEAWNDRALDHLQLDGAPASAADQIKAAIAAVPDSVFQAYELPTSANAAVRVIVLAPGVPRRAVRVYVHPQSLAILHTVNEDSRVMRILFKLHGELLMGNWGSMLVELAASWAIILIITGLYLWWPRQFRGQGVGGLLYPRLFLGPRVFWRDIHCVTGLWISAFALFLLLSGLPWAKFWGDYFKSVRQMTGTAVVQQDWPNGQPWKTKKTGESSSGAGGEHREHGSHNRHANAVKDFSSMDKIIAAVQPLGLLPPVQITAPTSGASNWGVKSMTPNRPQRVDLIVDGNNGEIVSRKNFSDRHVIDRIVGTSVALHEGQLFGWPNQLLGLFTASGLFLVSVSSLVLWWRRRDKGVLGAPPVAMDARISWILVVFVLLLGVFLPMFGASLILVLLLERLVFRRFSSIAKWLGLNVPSRESAQG